MVATHTLNYSSITVLLWPSISKRSLASQKTYGSKYLNWLVTSFFWQPVMFKFADGSSAMAGSYSIFPTACLLICMQEVTLQKTERGENSDMMQGKTAEQ